MDPTRRRTAERFLHEFLPRGMSSLNKTGELFETDGSNPHKIGFYIRKGIEITDERYACNYSDRRFGFDAGGRSTEMAAQPGLGVLPERRFGPGLSTFDRLVAVRPALATETLFQLLAGR